MIPAQKLLSNRKPETIKSFMNQSFPFVTRNDQVGMPPSIQKNLLKKSDAVEIVKGKKEKMLHTTMPMNYQTTTQSFDLTWNGRTDKPSYMMLWDEFEDKSLNNGLATTTTATTTRRPFTLISMILAKVTQPTTTVSPFIQNTIPAYLTTNFGLPTPTKASGMFQNIRNILSNVSSLFVPKRQAPVIHVAGRRIKNMGGDFGRARRLNFKNHASKKNSN